MRKIIAAGKACGCEGCSDDTAGKSSKSKSAGDGLVRHSRASYDGRIREDSPRSQHLVRSGKMASRARRVGMAAALGVCAVAAIFGACSPDKGFGPPKSGSGGSGQGGAGGDLLPTDDGGPPPLDAQGLCGNQLHALIFDAPNVYFIIDASGSMAQAAGGTSRFAVVRKASINLVRDLGPLINVGAALFPVGATDQQPCAPGAEVMPITPGDAYTGSDGPTISEFKSATNATPNGGTPTSATLAALLPTIQGASGKKTIVLLVTDGGPNCNAAASCDGAHCGPNIEGCTGDTCCDPGGNCCAPAAPGGPASCIDTDATVKQIEAYEKVGLPVYVIGIPGSEAYADVLQQMAFAAGTAQIAKPYYYAVSDVDNLHGVLASIAAVAVSCVFTLDDPPMVDDQTNVYLDGVVLPNGGNDGWRWMDPDLKRIELLGDACARLKAGQIKTVQIVSGCPTEPSK